MELIPRKLAILTAIIEDYIATGVPVGSRTISKKPGVDLSSATIRNEMADLEELGFLEQPHTSSGRVPSDKAYRLYVDRLMRQARLTEKEAQLIKQCYSSNLGALEDIIAQTADVLSSITEQISLVLAPKIENTEIKRIQLVKISETKVLLLVVTNTGLVREVCLTVPAEIDVRHMDVLSNMLTELAYNKTLKNANWKEIEAFLGDIRYKKAFIDGVLESIIASGGKKQSVVLGGTKNIFNFPEYKDVEKARNFLEVLETRDMLERLLLTAKDFEFTIKIGQENEFNELKDMSVITATYKIGGVAVGSFGVLGPTRMNYAKIVSILNYVGSTLNEILSSYIDGEE